MKYDIVSTSVKFAVCISLPLSGAGNTDQSPQDNYTAFVTFGSAGKPWNVVLLCIIISSSLVQVYDGTLGTE